MDKIQVSLVLILFILVSTAQAEPAGEKVFQEKMQHISIQYDPDLSTADGFFLELDKGLFSGWKLLQISSSPITRRQNRITGEVIFVNRDLTFAQPCFVGTFIRSLNRFDCNGNPNSNVGWYDPCHSRFTVMDWIRRPGIDANHFSKYVSSEIVKEVLMNKAVQLALYESWTKSQEMAEAEKRDNQERAEAEKERAERKKRADDEFSRFKNSVKITPVVEDQSGFYNGESLFQVAFEPKYSSYSETSPRVYIIRILHTDNGYDMKISPDSYEMTYSGDDIALKPKITLSTKHFKEIRPRGTFSDGSLEIVINRASSSAQDVLNFNIDIRNKSTKYITIKSLSFYLGGAIITDNRDIELPPDSVQHGVELITEPFTATEKELNRKAAGVVKNVTTYKEAANKPVEIAVSAKYTIDDATKTLYKANTYTLLKLLGSQAVTSP